MFIFAWEKKKKHRYWCSIFMKLGNQEFGKFKWCLGLRRGYIAIHCAYPIIKCQKMRSISVARVHCVCTMCMHVCVFVYMFMYTHVCQWRPEVHLWCHSSGTENVSDMDTWGLPFRLGWLPIEPQGSTDLHLLIDGITSTCQHICLSLWGTGGTILFLVLI